MSQLENRTRASVVGAIQTAYRSAILIRYAKNNYKKMVMNKEGKKA
jgi:hypothetical protein